MRQSEVDFSGLKTRKLILSIALAFFIGVTSILVITFFINQKLKRFDLQGAVLSQLLIECGKQKTISKYLYENAVMCLKDASHPVTLNHLDSVLMVFQSNHLYIEKSTDTLSETGNQDFSKIDSLITVLSTSSSYLVLNSHELRETLQGKPFLDAVLDHSKAGIPTLNALSNQYNQLKLVVGEEFRNTISWQYWFICGVVVLSASIVFLFTIRLINRHSLHTNKLIELEDQRSDSSKEEKKKKRYKRGLRILDKLNTRSRLSIQERLEKGLKECVDFLELDFGIISDIWIDEYKIVAFYPESMDLEIDQKFKLGETYCDLTLSQQGKIFSVDHMKKSEFNHHPCFDTFQLESYIGAAYRVNGKVAGTVNFTSSNPRKRSFTDTEMHFVSLVASWVGSVLSQQGNDNKRFREQNLLKTFVSSAPAAIAMLDKHMNYISASKRWYKDHILNEEDVIGKSHYKVFPDMPDKWKEMHKRALSGEIIKPGVEKFVRKNGKVQWLKGEVQPWYKSKGKIGGIIIYVNDLTEIKQKEEELKIAKEEAENAGKIKEQFLSTMSHEIRTPLNAIIGNTNLLEIEHPHLAENSRIKMLKFGSNNLLNLINDILDFQKMASGKLDLVANDVNLQDLIAKVIDTWKAASQLGKVDLKYSYSGELSSCYICDEARLMQIFNNLISNALKFTEKGEVKLQVYPDEDGKIVFAVKDTGIGISPKNLETIFESFRQISNVQNQQKGGTGLGLAICKRLVDMMGGELEVVSQVNKGTTFSFAIPLKVSEKRVLEKEKVKELNVNLGINILLAEDNLANQEIAKGFLTRWGINVDVANNGEEAVAYVKKKGYDLVLMDMRMPVMSGYEAVKQIRAMEDGYFQELPIIALTASTLSESRDKMMESGINEIVNKPFDPQDLLDKVSKASRREEQTNQSKEMEEHTESQESQASYFKFLSKVLGGDEEKIWMIAKMAFKSVADDMDGTRNAMLDKDTEKAHNHLHKMKSNLANLDLKDLSDIMPNHKADDFWENLPPFLDKVEGELHRIEGVING